MRRAACAGVAALIALACGIRGAAADPRAELDARIAAAGATDERAATWLVDRAALELAMLGADGADASLLFGVPSAAQKRRGEAAARAALRLLDQGAERAAAAVSALEEGMMGREAAGAEARARAEAAEAALTRLVDVEQAQRIPYYRGLSGAILASCLDGASRAETARSAAAGLAELRARGPAGRAGRVAWSAAMLNGGSAGRVLSKEEADALVSEMEEIGGRSEGVDAATARWARLAARLARRFRGEEIGPPIDAVEREVDARVLLARSRQAGPDRRQALAAEACGLLLQSAAPDAAPEARLAVYEKIAAAIEPGIDMGGLPAEAALARAVTLLREQAGSMEARAILAQLVQRPAGGVGAAVRREALWESAAALLRDEQAEATIRAVELLGAFAAEFAEDARAGRASRTIAALSARVEEGAARARIEAVETAALDRLIANPPEGSTAEEIDAWRSRRVVIGVRAIGTDARSARPEAVAGLTGLAAGIRSKELTAGGAALAQWVRRIVEDESWKARPVEERLRILESARRVRPMAEDPLLALNSGEAKLELGRPGAADDLRGLIGGALDRGESRARVRLALAAALAGTAAGRAEATGLLREITAPLDDSPSTTVRPPEYWRAWAAMLEMMEGDAKTPEDVAALRTQVRRLEILDPGLGGAETARRIGAVRERVKGRE